MTAGCLRVGSMAIPRTFISIMALAPSKKAFPLNQGEGVVVFQGQGSTDRMTDRQTYRHDSIISPETFPFNERGKRIARGAFLFFPQVRFAENLRLKSEKVDVIVPPCVRGDRKS